MSIWFSVVLATSAATSPPLGDPSTVARLAELGKNENRCFQTLESLCNRFGPRLTGSPSLARAQEWALAEFKRYGIPKVYKEQWGEVPVGFSRGARQSVKMTSPWPMELTFTTPAWTPGTPGKIKVSPILEPETLEEYEKVKDQLKGKWIVMRRQSGIRGPQGQVTAVERAMEDLAVAGRIYGAGDERVHTGGRFTGLTMDNLPKSATVRVRKSDHDSLMLAFRAGRSVELEMDIENKFIKGPVPQYNVIAEIPGTEKPDEIVIVCGHFDSWDGPGSKGANDNGTGSSVTLEAARLMMAAGAKPKRTVRFILWSGEEQGLLGSRAYVEKHKNEMAKVSAVFNDDGGTNYQGGYNILESMKPILEAAISTSQKTFPNLPMTLNVVKEMPRGGSSDHAPFVWVGVPGFFTIEAGKADYGFVWHTQNDRPQYSVDEYLTQSSTNAALVAYQVASAPDLLPRVPIQPNNASPGRPAGGTRHFYNPAEIHIHEPGEEHDHTDEFEDFQIESVLRWLGLRG